MSKNALLIIDCLATKHLATKLGHYLERPKKKPKDYLLILTIKRQRHIIIKLHDYIDIRKQLLTYFVIGYYLIGFSRFLNSNLFRRQYRYLIDV